MIAIRATGDRCAPILICDECQQRIVDAKAAVAVDPDLSEIRIAHKGNCHRAAEARFGDSTWTELSTCLARLVVNSGLDLHSFGSELEIMDQL